MNDDNIKEMIASLDEQVPKQGAKVLFQSYGGGPGEERIVANKLGFLRLGIEFLRAAYETPRPSPAANGCEHVADITYLLSRDSDFGFNCVKRNETVATSLAAHPRRRRLP